MSSAETLANLASKQSRNALQRLDRIDGKDGILDNHSQSLKTLQTQFSQYVAIVDAAVELLGVEAITAKVKENAEKEAAKKKESEEAQIKQLLELGVLSTSEAVTVKSVVVGCEIKKGEGVSDEVLFPGRQQVVFNDVTNPELRTALLGKKVGEDFPLPNGNFFKVTEIYNIIEQKAQAVSEVLPVDVPEVAVAPV
jgi:hypothetical protein